MASAPRPDGGRTGAGRSESTDANRARHLALLARCRGVVDGYVPSVWERFERSIPEAFDESVARHGRLVAITEGTFSLSYLQLDAASRGLALTLLGDLKPQIEGRPRAPVAVLVESCADGMIAMLGVLRTGRPCVPLDRAWPESRLRQILDHCGADSILSAPETAVLAASVAGPNRVVVDLDACAEAARPQARSQAHPLGTSACDDPAVVLYTTGSTGPPKGVIDTHRNLLHEARRIGGALGVSPGDRHSYLRADCAGAVSDALSALLGGATLVPFDLLGSNVEGFREWLERERPTLWRSAPSYFRATFGALAPDGVAPDLRAVFLCGEPVLASDHALFRRHCSGDAVFLNCFGATEVGTVTLQAFEHGDIPPAGVLPIGHPVEGMDLVLLDEEGCVVEGAGEGVIAVRSRFLARGYVAEPALTARAFRVTDDESGTRMFVTADVGQRSADGTIRCVERAASDDSADPRIERRPLTTSGKLDRAALRAARGTPDEPGTLQLTSRTTPELQARDSVLEPQLLGLWRAALDCDEISTTDPFFEAGGDSLRAVELATSIERWFGRRVTATSLLQTPTVEAFAMRLQDEGWAPRWRSLVPLGGAEHVGVTAPVFLAHGWRGTALGLLPLARALASKRPVYGLQAVTNDGGTPAHRTVEEMASHYAREVREVRGTGPYHLVGHSAGGWMAYAVALEMRRCGATDVHLTLVETGSVEALLRGHAGIKLRDAAWHRARFVKRAIGRAWRRLRTGEPAVEREGRDDAYAVALARYRAPTYDGDITIVLGDEADAQLQRKLWVHFVRGAVRMERIGGSHMGMLAEEGVGELAQVLNRALTTRF